MPSVSRDGSIVEGAFGRYANTLDAVGIACDGTALGDEGARREMGQGRSLALNQPGKLECESLGLVLGSRMDLNQKWLMSMHVHRRRCNESVMPKARLCALNFARWAPHPE